MREKKFRSHSSTSSLSTSHEVTELRRIAACVATVSTNRDAAQRTLGLIVVYVQIFVSKQRLSPVQLSGK
jgi:hypothetical protein